MRKTSLKLCGFTVIMGIFGAFLRWVQNLNVFEADTGLAASHAPWSYAVAAFILLFAVLLFVIIRKLRDLDFDLDFPEVYAKGVPFVRIMAGFVAAALVIGGVLTLVRAINISKSAFDIILGFFALLCAVGASSFLVSTAKPKQKNGGVFGAVTTVFFLCFWLIRAYKFSASDPVVWHFAIRLLSIAALVLAFYYIAGFVFNKPRPLATLYFGQLAVFLCLIVLADSYPIGEQLITVGFIVQTLLLSFTQINGSRKYD